MTTATATAEKSRARLPITIAAVVLAALVVVFFIVVSVMADWLWYEQVDFLPILTTQWIAAGVMFVIGFVAMAVPVWASISLAYRARPVYAKLNSQLDRYREVIEPLRRLATYGIPAVLGVFAGFSAATSWQRALLALNATPFGEVDPQFGFDLSFFMFQLPFLRQVVAFASAVALICSLVAVAMSYLYGSIRISGREVQVLRPARVQMAITIGFFVLIQAVSLWLDQYATLYQPATGYLATGAGYTEVHATIQSKAILAGAALLVALLFFLTAFTARWRFPMIGTATLLVVALLVGAVYPWIVQRFQVEPSARSVEAPYIQRSIDATRDAYGVAEVTEVPYSAETDATAGALREDAQTTASIRILDPAIAPLAFQQLEQVKQYYSFPGQLDVDRYTIDGEIQDTVLAVRDINLEGNVDARTWYNDTIVYTHGYGVVAAYGNQRAEDGQPLFLEAGIPSTGTLGEFEPRIYFGETSPEYSIVGAPEGADPVELDYPSSGEENSQNQMTTFTGNGGPTLDNFFKRLVYALKFQSEQILFSDAVNDESQILYDRSPAERVSKVAPFLTLDSDPYPAVVDGKVVWIVDAYTTGTTYPYSEVRDLNDAIADSATQTNPLATTPINYIRNSVKATVDAYDGTVTLYAWDETDPVLQTWQKIFPDALTPASEMSAELIEHVRYPSDLFKMQREILGSFHVTDPGSFYSGDDQWVTPNDPVGGTERLQPPYYLTMKVPGFDEPGFTIYSTFIPRASSTATRNVLTGYLAANGDAGEDYGKLTLLTLPTQTVPGPGQVQNSFQTDTIVAPQLTLLESGGREVKLGNLLTLPVGGGLLYVQPVYVQSTSGTIYPLLRKVLVSFGDRIAFEDTLDAALDELFQGDSGANAGDSDLPAQPDGTEDPNVEPVDTPDPTDEPDPTNTADPTPPSTGNATLDQALADYQQALGDRTAAYAAGDLVAAAEADKRMLEAIERALAATE